MPYTVTLPTPEKKKRRQYTVALPAPPRVQPIPAGTVAGMLREQAAVRTGTPYHENPLAPGAPTLRLEQTALGRIVGRGVVEAGLGAGGEFIPPVRQEFRAAIQGLAPRSKPERIAQGVVGTGGQIAGFTLGVPGRALSLFRAVPIVARATGVIGRVAGPKLAPALTAIVQAGGEGSLYGTAVTLTDEWDRINKIREKYGTPAAATYVVKRAAVHGVTWAAFTGGLQAAAGGARALIDAVHNGQVTLRSLEQLARAGDVPKDWYQDDIRGITGKKVIPASHIDWPATRAQGRLVPLEYVQTALGPVRRSLLDQKLAQQVEVRRPRVVAMLNAAMNERGEFGRSQETELLRRVGKTRLQDLTDVEIGTLDPHARARVYRALGIAENPQEQELIKRAAGITVGHGPQTMGEVNALSGLLDQAHRHPGRDMGGRPPEVSLSVRFNDLLRRMARQFAPQFEEDLAKAEQLLLAGRRAEASMIQERALQTMHQMQGWSVMQLLKGESGQYSLDTQVGELIKSTKNAITSRRRAGELFRDMEAYGALLLNEGKDAQDWEAAMLERFPVKGVDQALDKIYAGSRRYLAKLSAQTVEGTLPTLQKLTELFRRGEDAHDWYDSVRSQLEDMVGPDDARWIIRVLAATSAAQKVEENVARTIGRLYYQHKLGLPLRGAGLAQPIIERVIAGDYSALGRKTQNFLRAMEGDPNAYVHDRWMNRALGFKTAVVNDEMYNAGEEWTREGAKAAGVSVRQFQAGIWAGVRRDFGVANPGESFMDVVARRPDLLRRLQIMLPRVTVPQPGQLNAPEVAEWATPEAVRQSAMVERYAIIAVPAETSIADYPEVAKLLQAGERPIDALVRTVAQRGYTPLQAIPTTGRWTNPAGKVEEELGLLVRDMQPAEAAEIGRLFHQQAVVTTEGILDVATNQIAPRGSAIYFGDEALAKPGSTTILTTRGPLHFSIDYDFNNLVKHPNLGQISKQLLIGEAGAAGPGAWRGRMQWDGQKLVPLEGDLPPSIRDAATAQVRRENVRHIMETGNPLPPGEVEVTPGGKGILKVAGNILAGAEEVATSFKLTHPLTHERNMLGNVFAMLFAPAEKAVAGGIGTAARAVGLHSDRYLGEGAADLVGRMAALPDAMRNFTRVLLTEMQNPENLGLGQARRAVPGEAGRLVRMPFRFLAASDEFFREINRQANIRSLAYRAAVKSGVKGEALLEKMAALVANPTPEMQVKAKVQTREYLFQDELGRWASLMQQLSNLPGGKFFVPFVRTPVNVAKFFLRRTPLGLTTLYGATKGQLDVEDALARTLVGSTFLTGMTMLSMGGHITGGGPNDAGARRLLEQQGWQPYSIRIGNKYVSYRGLEPLASFLAVPATAVEVFKYGRPDARMDELVGQAIGQSGRLFLDASFLMQINQAFEAMNDPRGFLESAQRLGASIVGGAVIPRFVAGAAEALDPYQRRPETFIERIKVQVPGLREQVPPALDVYGRPMARIGIPFLPRVTEQRDDPLAAELLRLRMHLPDVSKTRIVGGERVERSRSERADLRERRGQFYREILLNIVTDPDYQQLSDAERKRVIQRFLRRIGEATSE